MIATCIKELVYDLGGISKQDEKKVRNGWEKKRGSRSTRKEFGPTRVLALSGWSKLLLQGVSRYGVMQV